MEVRKKWYTLFFLRCFIRNTYFQHKYNMLTESRDWNTGDVKTVKEVGLLSRPIRLGPMKKIGGDKNVWEDEWGQKKQG